MQKNHDWVIYLPFRIDNHMHLKLKVTLIFFIIAMIMGWLLRYFMIAPFTFLEYKHLLHAHSHVVLLGWAFNASFLAITMHYDRLRPAGSKKQNILFWVMQGTIFLAMVAFLIRGYALFSILFSTVFLFTTYYWVALSWKQIKGDRSIGGQFILWALLLLVLSSIGPWSLGFIMKFVGRSHPSYPLSIYYYLHFLYNGFILFALIGSWFHWMDDKGYSYSALHARQFLKGMKWAVFPLYALSAVWLNAGIWINIAGLLAALVQLWAGWHLWHLLSGLKWKAIFKNNRIQYFLGVFIVTVFYIKIFLQFLSGFQWVADRALMTKSYSIVGYIHLVMLGLISIFFLWYFIVQGWMKYGSRMVRSGLFLFISGVFLSEIMLLGQGVLIIFSWGHLPDFPGYICAVSALMPLGIILVFAGQLQKQAE